MNDGSITVLSRAVKGGLPQVVADVTNSTSLRENEQTANTKAYLKEEINLVNEIQRRSKMERCLIIQVAMVSVGTGPQQMWQNAAMTTAQSIEEGSFVAVINGIDKRAMLKKLLNNVHATICTGYM